MLLSLRMDDIVIQLPTGDASAVSPELRAFLRAQGLVGAETAVTLEHADAGNMNRVRRARTSDGATVILKQALPWVEKYPSIAAPAERAEAEARFYRLVGGVPAVAARMPRLLAHDAASHLLVLEDLAPAAGCEAVYAGARFSAADLDALADWLAALHAVRLSEADARAAANRDMRALNHAHIFDLPWRPDGPFDAVLESVTPGLAAEAARLRADAALVAALHRLGDAYLGDAARPRLLHGDFFPGSLMRRADGSLAVIDPEFGFPGDPAFDVGVFAAHLALSGHGAEVVEGWFGRVRDDAGARSRARAWAGAEILRRLVGIAQLPLDRSLTTKVRLLELGREWVLRG